MKPRVLGFVFTLLAFQLYAADYYWVGGAGNWSDLSHWSSISGGPANKSIIPGPGDDVYFDANSGLANGSLVTFPASGHAYCRNLSWVGVSTNAVFQNSTGFTLYIYGNAELSGAVRYDMQRVVFTGSSNATYKFNNAARVAVAGRYNPFTIDKAGGSLTLLDNIPAALAVSYVSLLSGHFNMSGGTHEFGDFVGSNSTVRSLDISNATLIVLGAWDYRGNNGTLNATGSYIKALNFLSDRYSFPKVDIDRVNTGDMVINNTTFGELTFTSTAGAPGVLRIGSNNTINRLEFKSGGGLQGAGNVIGKLILAPASGYHFVGNNNINDSLKVNTPDCSGLTDLLGATSSPTLTFGAGVQIDAKNVYIKDLAAAGSITPVAVTGADGGGNTGWTFTPPAAGTTLYWVGGPGNWNDKNHWSNTSGGPGGACVPFMNDNVVFDANSGLASGTITTTSSSLCKDMTWTGVGTVTFSQLTGSSLNIYGSLVMDNSVTMNALLGFAGSDPVSITTNGSTLGGLQFIISKSGGAVVTLADNWTNATGSFVHRSGGLNLSGRTVNVYFYSSSLTATRSLDISNATLFFSNYWDYRGGGKTLSATGSHISSNGGFGADGLSYPWVDITGTAGLGIGFPISGTTFGQLTFTNPSPASGVFLGVGNTVRRLEFKGKGAITQNNTIDSVILTGSMVYGIGNNVSINRYLMAESMSCSGLLEMRGTGSIAFAAGAEIHIANVYMQNITATGPMTPIAFNGADAGGKTGWTITSAPGGARYWVGGSGDWNNNMHWSATSGGAGGTACVPTVYDDVYFDAGSFSSGSSSLTINNGNAYCRSMNWTGATASPVLNKNASFNLEVWGDLVMNPAVTINGRMNFTGAANSTITPNGANLGDFDIIILKSAGSTVTLADNYSNSLTEIELRSGGLNISGRTITVQWLTDSDVATASNLDITNAIFNGGWHYRGAARTLQAAGSVLNATIFRSNGHTYNVVNVTTPIDNSISIGNTTIDSLVFTNPSGTSQAWLGGTNTIGYLEFKGRGYIASTGNTIGDLVFYPGKQYSFLSGSNTTITGNWYGSGSPCNLTEITSSSTGNATITKTSGSPSFDYIRLRGITAAGSTPFLAEEHTVDMGNNVNWSIEPYNGSTPIVGLGPDIMLFPADFPYTLTTDGFFGSPLSQYTWNDGSTGNQLVITEPGNYGVAVSFADGCSISDQIVVVYNPLPITITSFTAEVQRCDVKLQWKVEDAENFSNFVVEQSRNGTQFTPIADIPYADGIGKYAYTDNTAGSGITWYRLKLVDIGGQYEYSTVATVRADCNSRQIQVRPTITSNNVQVVLPSGYEKAQLYIVNTSGQYIAPVVQGNGTLRTISLQGLPSATYMLQVINGSDIKTFKIVKQ